MKVGFIGLGTMGRNAAANVRRKGFAMVVYDIRPEAAEEVAMVHRIYLSFFRAFDIRMAQAEFTNGWV